MSGNKIWITGATGLLGRELVKEFSTSFEGETLGTGFSRAKPPVLKLDLLDPVQVETFIKEHKPRFILHCAAERRPDTSENNKEATTQLNVCVTRELARLAKAYGAWLLYISTDYVFDGTTPPYQTGDIPNPTNHYGQSKLAGENAIMDILDDYGILRVPILYGPVENLGESAVTSIANQLRKNPVPPIENWATRYPTHVADVAFVCRQMVQFKDFEAGFRGIFHWSGNEAFTKYGMACLMAPTLGIDPKSIPKGPDTDTGTTPRPKDCGLDISSIGALGFGSQRDFGASIREILLPFRTVA